jgi:hypothetical protein
MAKKKRNILKGFFETGKRPTEGNYTDLIDSFVSLKGENTGSLDVKGNAIIEGTISSSGDLIVSGISSSGAISASGTGTSFVGGTFIVGNEISASGGISSSGTIEAQQFIGDGRFLTNVTSSTISTFGVTASFTSGAPTGSLIVSGNLFHSSASSNVLMAIKTTGSIIPAYTSNYDLGSPTNYWKSLFVSNSFAVTYTGIFKGAISGSSLSSATQGTTVLTTNGVAGSTIDLGLQTTDSVTFHSITASNDISASGDITASGLMIHGDISASGTVYANNFQSVGGDVAGISFTDDLNLTGDLTSSGNISSSGTGSFAMVGIGTTTPTAKLDVNGEVSIGGGQAADEARLTFRASDESKRFTIETDLDNSTSNDLLGFRGSSTDNILVLKGDGNVGIGTSTPSQKLTVTGNISSSGNIILEGHITASGNISSSKTGSFGMLVVDQNITSSNISASGTLTAGTTTVGTLTSTAIITGPVSGTSNVTITGTGSFGEINLDDSKKIKLGTGHDLEIFHDGTNSVINDGGTGDLVIKATNLKLQSSAGEQYFYAASNGAVQLFHNNVQKLATTTTGVNITGNVTASGDISSSGTGSFGMLIVDQNLTSSGNISSSGDLTARNISVNQITSSGTTTLGGTTHITSSQLYTSSSVNLGVGLAVTGSILPGKNNEYDLGSPTHVWRDLFLSENSIRFVSASGKITRLRQVDVEDLRAGRPVKASVAIDGQDRFLRAQAIFHESASNHYLKQTTVGRWAFVGPAGIVLDIFEDGGGSNNSITLGNLTNTVTKVHIPGTISASRGNATHIIGGTTRFGDSTVTINGPAGHITASGNISASSTITSLTGSFSKINVGSALSNIDFADGIDVDGFVSAMGIGTPSNITHNTTIPSNVNAVQFTNNTGDITIASGVNYTVSAGATTSTPFLLDAMGGGAFMTGSLKINGSISSSGLIEATSASFGNLSVNAFGNITSSGNISASGALYGNLIYRNGTELLDLFPLTTAVVANSATSSFALSTNVVANSATSSFALSTNVVANSSTSSFATIGNNVNFLNITGSTISASGNVTTTNLSGSGDLRIAGTGSFSNLVVDGNSGLTISSGAITGSIISGSTIIASQLTGSLSGNASGLFGNPNIAVTQLTASATISSSGDIVANNLTVANTSSLNHITLTGTLSSSGVISAVSMSGDGSSLTGITAEWDGSRNGDANITGSLILSGSGGASLDVRGGVTASAGISSSTLITGKTNITNLTASQDISSSGIITGLTGSFSNLSIGSFGNITSSGTISSSGNITANSFTGIFVGAISSSTQIAADISSSFVTNSATSSLILSSQTSSFVLNSQSSSFVLNSQTGSLSNLTITGSGTTNVSITTAGNITASGGVNALGTSSLGMLIVSQNVTASNISASGTLTAGTTTVGALTATTINTGQGNNELYDMDQNVLTTSTVKFSVIHGTSNTGTALINSGSTLLGNAISDTHTITGNVTASGNISSSGTITATTLAVDTFTPSTINTGNITGSGTISASGLLSASNIHTVGNVTLLGNISGSGTTSLTVGGSTILNQITASGILSSSTNIIASQITASTFSGDGSGLTGVTSEWDGTLNGNAQITGSLILSGSGNTNLNVLGDITGSSISASGTVYAQDIVASNTITGLGFNNPTSISTSTTVPAGYNSVFFVTNYNPSITVPAGIEYTISLGADVTLLNVTS